LQKLIIEKDLFDKFVEIYVADLRNPLKQPFLLNDWHIIINEFSFKRFPNEEIYIYNI
jgi:hypothetical protein